MPISPDQLYHALDPLNGVDVKALDEIAKSLKNSRSKQKRAVGVFLDRINKYRLNETPKKVRSNRPTAEMELLDLQD